MANFAQQLVYLFAVLQFSYAGISVVNRDQNVGNYQPTGQGCSSCPALKPLCDPRLTGNGISCGLNHIVLNTVFNGTQKCAQAVVVCGHAIKGEILNALAEKAVIGIRESHESHTFNTVLADEPMENDDDESVTPPFPWPRCHRTTTTRPSMDGGKQPLRRMIRRRTTTTTPTTTTEPTTTSFPWPRCHRTTTTGPNMDGGNLPLRRAIRRRTTTTPTTTTEPTTTPFPWPRCHRTTTTGPSMDGGNLPLRQAIRRQTTTTTPTTTTDTTNGIPINPDFIGVVKKYDVQKILEQLGIKLSEIEALKSTTTTPQPEEPCDCYCWESADPTKTDIGDYIPVPQWPKNPVEPVEPVRTTIPVPQWPREPVNLPTLPPFVIPGFAPSPITKKRVIPIVRPPQTASNYVPQVKVDIVGTVTKTDDDGVENRDFQENFTRLTPVGTSFTSVTVNCNDNGQWVVTGDDGRTFTDIDQLYCLSGPNF